MFQYIVPIPKAVPSRSQSTKMSASLVAGIANFGIQFNYSSISLAILLIEQIYGDPPGWASPAMTSTVFAGSIVGMLGMGFLGDLVGRKQAMAITLSVAAAGSLLSAFGVFGAENVTYGLIAFWRFVLGIGVGGTLQTSSDSILHVLIFDFPQAFIL